MRAMETLINSEYSDSVSDFSYKDEVLRMNTGCVPRKNKDFIGKRSRTMSMLQLNQCFQRYTLKTLVIFLAIFSFMFIICHAFISRAQESNIEYGYRSVRIESGDTLSDIITENLPGSGMTYSYLEKEIRRINHLGTDKLYAGAYLIVPVVIEDL